MNEEITKVLTEILDSKTVEKLYNDGLKGSVSETGSALTDTVKALRLFTAPIQLAAAYQDRLSSWIDREVRKIPEENLIPAPARIAGPIFEELKYLDEGDVISEMYISLLSKAINKEKNDLAHPGFVKIIGHLSPDEALILHYLKSKYYEEKFHSEYDRNKNIFHSKKITFQEFPVSELLYPNNFYVYTSHLMSLDLVEFPIYKKEPTFSGDNRNIQNGENGYARLHLSEFGEMFVHACEPCKRTE